MNTEINVSPKRRKSKTYQCNFENCEMIFPKKCILDDHIRAHNGEKPYVCNVCKKGFTQLGNLKNHEKNHISKPKTFNCELCPKTFTSKSYLNVFIP
jgi:KRAB domain-containing zinc finger protein